MIPASLEHRVAIEHYRYQIWRACIVIHRLKAKGGSGMLKYTYISPKLTACSSEAILLICPAPNP